MKLMSILVLRSGCHAFSLMQQVLYETV